MPEISQFMGMTLEMPVDGYADPHFQATYNEHKIVMRIEDGAALKGGLTPRASGYVHEWRAKHVEELKENWLRVIGGSSPVAIEPLE